MKSKRSDAVAGVLKWTLVCLAGQLLDDVCHCCTLSSPQISAVLGFIVNAGVKWSIVCSCVCV